MSNPYMREALVDEMEQETRLRPGGRRTPPGQPVSTAYAEPGPVEPETPPVPPPPGGGSVAPPPPSPWDSPTSSKYAPRVVQRGDQSYLTEHGNERLLQPGQEIEDATKYQQDFWNQYPTGFQPGVGPQTNEEYAPPAPQGGGGALGASGATAGRYSGFDTQRAQDPSKSAKDAFLQAANASGSMPSTKEEAEAWFNQYVKAELEAAGYQVDWVDGDKAFVRTRENPGGEEIDFLINAGGENPQLGWQSNMAGMTTGDGSGADTGGGGSASDAILGNEDVLSDINAAIAQLMEQGISLEDIQALIASGGAGN